MPDVIIPFDESLLKVKFEGPGLGIHGVPIYELGTTLIAIQRMVHKAYLVDQELETKRLFLSRKERDRLALQLGGRKSASDGYGIVPLLTSGAGQNAVGGFIAWIMSCLTAYALRRVFRRDGDKDKQHIFNVIVFNQLSELAGRIRNDGVEVIQIATSLPNAPQPVRLDKEFKKYVGELKGQMAYGEMQEIQGKVVDLIPGENAVKITREAETTIKVLLTVADFEEIRYTSIKNPIVRFTGEPMYRLGVETYNYEAFNAHSMVILGGADDEVQSEG